jgi:phosphatidyl-myo-inositol alpha-mannosyltransferase
MKIAMTHVQLPNETKSGVAHQAHSLANALVNQGHDVTMFTFSPDYSDCRYQVYQYKIPNWIGKFKPFAFAACLARTDFSAFEIVHTHGDSYLLDRRYPHVRTFHGSAKDEATSAVRLRRYLYQTVLNSLEQYSAGLADIDVGVSQATQQRIQSVSNIIPCGVALDQFFPGSKTEHPTLLFVGTASGRKRGQFLADIFVQEVRSRFPNAELWAVSDNPLQGESIINFGRISTEKLADLYRRAWMLCLPSTYEGFGVPYIEAMASGTVAIASLNPGAIEVLQNGQFGVIAQDHELGSKINQLIENAELRDAYCSAGKNRVQRYSWETVLEEYEHLYLQVAHSRQANLVLAKP